MDVSDFEEFEEKSESKCLRVKVAIGSMCGPRDVAVDSPAVTTATGESTGQDRSSAAGIFVLTVEHVHGGGGVLLFVIVIIFALVLAWCCARNKCCSWRRALDRSDSNGGNDDSEAGIKAPGSAGWLPRCS